MTLDVVECPRCGATFADEGHDLATCPRCGATVDVEAQRACARGLALYHEARPFVAPLTPLPPRARRAPPTQREAEAVLDYQRAESALRLALGAPLPEAQRRRALEALAAVSGALASRGLAAPLEARYWAAAAAEDQLLDQLEDAERALASSPRGFAAWQARRRVRRLRQAVERAQRDLADLEASLAFADMPHARREARER